MNSDMNQKIATELNEALKKQGVCLVAVSKTKPIERILEVYKEGIRHFGENRVQELVQKKEELPDDIRWHMIGNLQSNKVKYIAPFVHLIHSVSSRKLLSTIHKEGQKNDRIIPVLLQLRIAKEDSKSGMMSSEIFSIIDDIQEGAFNHVKVHGLMGMATFTSEEQQIRDEFRKLKSCSTQIENEYQEFFQGPPTLSFGMSGDYKIAVEEGSNMVRIGSLIFGAR